MIKYLDFFTNTLPTASGMEFRYVIVHNGIALAREPAHQPRWCPRTTRYWQSEVRRVLQNRKWEEIDLIEPTESYLDLKANNDRWVPHCALQDRHLTCITTDPQDKVFKNLI